MRLTLLYRGPLKSCNFACWYCPFSTNQTDQISQAELQQDQDCLEQFCEWVGHHTENNLKLFFTPYGEALIHKHYQETLIALSRLPHLSRVVIQTNLSCEFNWLKKVDRQNTALWISYHPNEMEQKELLSRCQQLNRWGVRHSVGLVGLHENIACAEQLRQLLDANTYLWMNAYKDGGNTYYSQQQIERLCRVDPFFELSLKPHESLGHTCQSGQTVLSVDGQGNAKRCHFVESVRGNIYRDKMEQLLSHKTCPKARCSCHIGYVHLDRLGLYKTFANGQLERIPG